LSHPLNSETVQLHLDHWCSSQSCTLNTGAVKNGDVLDIHTRLQVVTEFPTMESSRLTDNAGSIV
jgi:hypothetical protein